MRPNIHFQTDTATIWHGDSIETMRQLPDNSIDSIVTDPPYGLGFMGKAWDALPPGEEWAAECLRVLKPGGHLIAFGGSRTWHRLAVAVEGAGFEIRDGIAWLYGSGFPKSLDVSKAIDKARTEDVEPIRVVCRAIRAAMDAKGLKSKDLTQHFDGCHSRLIDHWAARDTDSQPAMPKVAQYLKLKEVLDMSDDHDAEVWRLNGRKGTHGEDWQAREITGHHTQAAAGQTWNANNGLRADLTPKERRDNPASEAAAAWQGWGTSLKPAFEPAVLARKPMAGSVAANVQVHGTGALKH